MYQGESNKIVNNKCVHKSTQGYCTQCGCDISLNQEEIYLRDKLAIVWSEKSDIFEVSTGRRMVDVFIGRNGGHMLMIAVNNAAEV
jgi:hypothetical protein